MVGSWYLQIMVELNVNVNAKVRRVASYRKQTNRAMLLSF